MSILTFAAGIFILCSALVVPTWEQEVPIKVRFLNSPWLNYGPLQSFMAFFDSPAVGDPPVILNGGIGTFSDTWTIYESMLCNPTNCGVSGPIFASYNGDYSGKKLFADRNLANYRDAWLSGVAGGFRCLDPLSTWSREGAVWNPAVGYYKFRFRNVAANKCMVGLNDDEGCAGFCVISLQPCDPTNEAQFWYIVGA